MYHAAHGAAMTDGRPGPEPGPELAPGRVLVIEDHAESRFVFRTVLELAGWEVDETSSGEEGLVIARQRRPALVILDISLPGLDGWETTRRLKAEHGENGLRVLAVTAHGLDEDRAKAREAGCDGYLVKPVDPRRLTGEVGRLVSRRPADEEPS
jgi:two-component system, cell cycle response regulator DivK